jgi:hypothetical protein
LGTLGDPADQLIATTYDEGRCGSFRGAFFFVLIPVFGMIRLFRMRCGALRPAAE